MNTAIKSLVMSLAIGFFAVNAQARMIGMLSETYSGSEKIKIESSGGKYDVSIQVDHIGLSTSLEATIETGFTSLDGDVQFEQSHEGKPALVITLNQPLPEMPNYSQLEGLSPEVREQKVKEIQSARLNAVQAQPRTEILSLYKDIIKMNIKPEYRNEVFYAILNGDHPLVLAFQQLKKGDHDFSMKYIVLSPEILRSGGTLYQTNIQP
ncbi:hypothetical protein [Bdellovibrio sp. HCB2-146]|uniref:hypothetical protein n=1 Tax=Bdellovibrio sp. HCB2-146 TaxID=3394362 RepID=UPI0039BD252C